MNILKSAVVVAVAGLLTACASPQDRAAAAQEAAYKAQEDVANRRIQFVNQYQSCIKDAGGNQQKAAACESYLKGADALK